MTDLPFTTSNAYIAYRLALEAAEAEAVAKVEEMMECPQTDYPCCECPHKSDCRNTDEIPF
jgi:hypothetical protein